MSSVEDQVRGIIAEQLGLKAEEIKNDASFVDDLGADSLDTVELVMALEEEFETEIPDEEAEKITTVQHAIDYIKARQSGGLSSLPSIGHLNSIFVFRAQGRTCLNGAS